MWAALSFVHACVLYVCEEGEGEEKQNKAYQLGSENNHIIVKQVIVKQVWTINIYVEIHGLRMSRAECSKAV